MRIIKIITGNLRKMVNELQDAIKRKDILEVFIGLFELGVFVFLGPLIKFAYEMYRLTRIESPLIIFLAFLFVLGIFASIYVNWFIYVKRNKRKKLRKVSFEIYIFGFILIYLLGILSGLNNALSNVSKGETTVSTAILVRADSEYTELADLSAKTIALLSDDTSYSSHILPLELFEEENISIIPKLYGNYDEIIGDFFDENSEIDAIAVPSNYVMLFGEVVTDVESRVKVIENYGRVIKTESETEVNPTEFSEKPFTVLLMGVDARKGELLSTAGADTLMLATINPKSLNIDLVSIPRDMYVPIACKSNIEDKITHSNRYGTKCVLNTVGNLLDVDIDYYVKLNFFALMDFVNLVGGIDVNIPMSFCGTDEDGNIGVICLDSGYQTLNGQEALSFARERNANGNNFGFNDVVRGEHQQLIIEALIKKFSKKSATLNISGIFNVISENIETNMNIDQVAGIYDMAKEITSSFIFGDTGGIIINNYIVSGYERWIFNYNLGKKLFYFIPFKGSIEDIKEQLYATLEKNFKTDIPNTFDFDPLLDYDLVFNPEFKEYNEIKRVFPDPVEYPDFAKDNFTYQMVVDWCNENDVNLTKVEVFDEWIPAGTAVSQDVEVGSYVSAKNNNLEISISKSFDPNRELLMVDIPAFGGKSVEDVEKWAHDNIVYTEIKYIYSDAYGKDQVAKVRIEKFVLLGDDSRHPQIKQREVLYIYISKGPVPKVDIGDYTLWNKQNFIAFAKENDFIIITYIYEYSDTIEKDFVITASVAPNTIVIYGDVISVTISLGQQTVILPDYSAWTEEEFTVFAQENNFIVLDIKRQESEDLEGTIISVSKEAGAELIKDDVLEVIISSGSTDDGADDGGE